jgi:hypothetical protein
MQWHTQTHDLTQNCCNTFITLYYQSWDAYMNKIRTDDDCTSSSRSQAD